MGDVVDLSARRSAPAQREGARLRRVDDLKSDITEIESWKPLVPGAPPFRADRLRLEETDTEEILSLCAAYRIEERLEPHERAAHGRPLVSYLADRQDATTRRIALLTSVCATLDALEPLSQHGDSA